MKWKDITNQTLEDYAHVQQVAPHYNFVRISDTGRFTISSIDGNFHLHDNITDKHYDGQSKEELEQLAQIIIQICLTCNEVHHRDIYTEVCDVKDKFCNCCTNCKQKCRIKQLL